MKYYKQLDGLRAVAIIGVMIAHWLQSSMTNPILQNLPYSSGVTLFFVLSGFLITKILLDFKEKNDALGVSQFNSIKSFYIRRSLRIFPIYYITIFVLFIINFSSTRELFPWLATYTTNIYMVMNSKYIGSFTHFWSLAVEEQFYIFWVFIIVFIPKHYIKGIISTFIAISVLLLFYLMQFTGYWLSDLLVICQMHTLGFGALIAYYLKYEPEFFEKISISKMKGYVVAGLVLYALVFVYRKPDELFEALKLFKYPSLSVVFFLMILIAVRNGFKGPVKYVLESRVMVYIGKISYGLYVYHLFISPLFLNILNKPIGLKTNAFGYFLVYFALNMILASVSWYVVEKPINNLKRFFNY
jgi:peptidoglycan/LPS O-acetylase OafA/YrhL